MIVSLKYYEDNYEYHFRVSSNITKYLTRASRSNTGTEIRIGADIHDYFCPLRVSCSPEDSYESKIEKALNQLMGSGMWLKDCTWCSSAKRENFKYFHFCFHATQITRISLVSLTHTARKLPENQCSNADSIVT